MFILGHFIFEKVRASAKTKHKDGGESQNNHSFTDFVQKINSFKQSNDEGLIIFRNETAHVSNLPRVHTYPGSGKFAIITLIYKNCEIYNTLLSLSTIFLLFSQKHMRKLRKQISA